LLILGIEYQKIVKKTNIVKKFLLDFANNRDYVKNHGYRLLRKMQRQKGNARDRRNYHEKW